MRRKKCLATLTMAAMVAASLAGCGSSGEKTDNSQAAVSGETTVSDSGEKKKDSGSATVVSMWHMWSGSEDEAFQTVIDDFNASQDEIQVEVLASQTEEKMLTAIPSGATIPLCKVSSGLVKNMSPWPVFQPKPAFCNLLIVPSPARSKMCTIPQLVAANS